MLKFSMELQALRDSVSYCSSHGQQPVDTLHQIEFDQLKNLAKRHGLLPSLFTYCLSNRANNSDLILSLKSEVSKRAIQTRLRIRQLQQLFSLFDAQHINYLQFKGLAAKAQFYKLPHEVMRTSADIDLLVKAEDFPDAVNILLAQDYYCIDCDNAENVAAFAAHSADKLCKRGLVFRHKNSNLCDVDLHWRMANSFSLPLPSQRVLEQKTIIHRQELTIPVPSFTHHFLLLCIHGYQDYFFQLKHLADIHFAKQQTAFNETAILDAATHYGVKKQVQESLILAHYMFSQSTVDETTLPPYVITCLKRYSDHNGVPPRMFKNQGKWTLRDKFQYIRHQINTRSSHASPIAPVYNRLLRSFHQV